MTDKNKNPKVTLVGAGPGDKDLITVKGLRALQNADVILYDALVNDELLDEAKEEAVKIFVGKRAGKPCLSQNQINDLIIQSAFEYGNCVRLKGGDPFVFGRGHEEMQHIRPFDIDTEVIPGISSSISVPLLQGIPVTRREVSESFWVLTGTTKEHKLSEDIRLAAKSTATLVILMGIRKLPLIADILVEAGKSEIPVMVIQSGSTKDEKYVIGKANDIVEKVNTAQITPPGIIVIGEVVSLHPTYITEKVKEYEYAD